MQENEFSVMLRKQLKNQIEFVLHTPGNYTGGILEMTIVLDHSIECKKMKQLCNQMAALLKTTGEVFRNVRLNVVDWLSDESMDNTVMPLSVLQLGRIREPWAVNEEEKTLEALCGRLKLFHARSKLILVLTEGGYEIGDKDKVKEALNPFLYRKLILLENNAVKAGRELLKL